MGLKEIIKQLRELDSKRTQGEWNSNIYNGGFFARHPKSCIMDNAQDFLFIDFVANNLSTLLTALEIQHKALERECCCTGELDYVAGANEPILCDCCEAINSVDRLFEKETK